MLFRPSNVHLKAKILKLQKAQIAMQIGYRKKCLMKLISANMGFKFFLKILQDLRLNPTLFFFSNSDLTHSFKR